MLMVSESGGMNIEEIAIQTPDKILTHHFEKLNQNNDEGLMKIADKLNLSQVQKEEFNSIIQNNDGDINALFKNLEEFLIK